MAGAEWCRRADRGVRLVTAPPRLIVQANQAIMFLCGMTLRSPVWCAQCRTSAAFEVPTIKDRALTVYPKGYEDSGCSRLRISLRQKRPHPQQCSDRTRPANVYRQRARRHIEAVYTRRLTNNAIDGHRHRKRHIIKANHHLAATTVDSDTRWFEVLPDMPRRTARGLRTEAPSSCSQSVCLCCQQSVTMATT